MRTSFKLAIALLVLLAVKANESVDTIPATNLYKKGDSCFAVINGAVYNLSPLNKKEGHKQDTTKYKVTFNFCD